MKKIFISLLIFIVITYLESLIFPLMTSQEINMFVIILIIIFVVLGIILVIISYIPIIKKTRKNKIKNK